MRHRSLVPLFKMVCCPGTGLALFGALLAASAAAAASDSLETALAEIRPQAIRADMSFLADDLLEGRGTGTRGHMLAAAYVASQFETLGLMPAGDAGTYFQDVPLRAFNVDQSKSAFTLTRAGTTETLTPRDDYALSGDPGRPDVTIKAPIVFAGFGITAPDQHYDDYAHLNAKGKIVAVLFGAPNFQAAIKAHYSASWLKRKNAAAHGAVGYMVLYSPTLEALYPYPKLVRDLTSTPEMRWLDASGLPNLYYPELKAVVYVSMATTKRLLEGSGHTAEEIYAASTAAKLRSFDLTGIAEIHTVSPVRELRSPNVVAKLGGGDSSLLAQYVVYTAHLDHLGVGAPVKGDSIYNGALDNASGIAALLSVARAFVRSDVKPRRSILFVAVTGEEKGLLGSDYFANNPTVAQASIVADINMDEDLMLWPLRDVVALGSEHSSLGGVVERATRALKLIASPDPAPEQVAFVRSDQYSFVRQGIPSMALTAGFRSDDRNSNPQQLFEHWAAERYHQPQDNMQQPGLNFDAAALYAKVGFLCGWYVANDDAAPTWNPGDFFGKTFARK